MLAKLQTNTKSLKYIFYIQMQKYKHKFSQWNANVIFFPSLVLHLHANVLRENVNVSKAIKKKIGVMDKFFPFRQSVHSYLFEIL